MRLYRVKHIEQTSRSSTTCHHCRRRERYAKSAMSLAGRDISTGFFKTLKAATLIIIEDEIVLGLNFHCELNFVEMVWGWTKSHHRTYCTYYYKDLKARLPMTLEEKLPIAFVRRAFDHCLRFMNGYC